MTHSIYIFFVSLIVSVCLPNLAVADAKVVSVWTYHDNPPFVVSAANKTGLTYDLARLLSERSAGRLRFDVEVLPRVRVDERLESGSPGVVFWVNDAWFGDFEHIRFFWSSSILEDENAVISPASKPFEYEGAHSLIGMDLVSVYGHHYEQVDALIDKGDVFRVDVVTQRAAFLSIASGHTDVSIQANSTAQHLVEELNLKEKVYFSRKPHSRYQRRILVQPQMHSVFDFIEGFAKQTQSDVKWRALLGDYNLDIN